MRYETTGDLLRQASELHEGLARYYQRLSDESGRERVKMLLDYLARHEANMAATLARFRQETAAHVRDAWFNFPLDEEFVKCIPPAKPVGSMETGEIVDLAIALDDCIIDLYQLIAMRSALPEARDAFANLVTLEREEKKKMVRQAMGLGDL